MELGIWIGSKSFANNALESEPQLAQKVAQIVTTFALIEGVVGGVYGVIRNQEIDDALQHLKNIPSNFKRVAEVRGVLSTRLSGSALAEAEEILNRVLKHAEARNKVAHGVWGIDEHMPGTLLRIPVKKWINFTASLIAHGTNGTAIPSIEALESEIEEYSLSDLQYIQDDGRLVLEAAFQLYNAVAALAAQADGWESKGEQ